MLMMAAVALMAGPAAAQSTYPSSAVTMIVPFSAGGGHDAMARVLAQKLAEYFHQSVIVENKPGANGMIGAEYVVRAKPDGYTVLFSSPAEIVVAPTVYKSMPYDPVKDLAPVTLAGTTPLVLVANPSAGVKTLPELIARAKREPGKWSYGTPGQGSSQNLAGAWLAHLAGIDWIHVPYKGAGPATSDILGDHIPFAIVGMAPVLPHIRDGKLVPIAVMTPQRVKWAKNVPTVAETPGMEGFVASHWMGVFLPAQTPADIVRRLQAGFAAVLAMPDVRERLSGMGIDAVGGSTDDFRAYLKDERERFATMFKYTGLKPE
jgi:tripartite-type tricarboxylate transporter receptor subunit TctC